MDSILIHNALIVCCRELSVLLDAEKAGEVELTVSYVVSKAKWSPKYDIRVFSNDGQLKVRLKNMRDVCIRRCTRSHYENRWMVI